MRPIGNGSVQRPLASGQPETPHMWIIVTMIEHHNERRQIRLAIDPCSDRSATEVLADDQQSRSNRSFECARELPVDAHPDSADPPIVRGTRVDVTPAAHDLFDQAGPAEPSPVDPARSVARDHPPHATVGDCVQSAE